LLVMKWTLPSQKQALTPLMCELRAWACQLGQLLGRLSLEQPIRNLPRPELPTPIAWRTWLQSSMSSEYSFMSLGTVASPVGLAAVMLEPASPMAQTPRRSFSFRPTRTSLNMMVAAVPSVWEICVSVAPQLIPMGPPHDPV